MRAGSLPGQARKAKVPKRFLSQSLKGIKMYNFSLWKKVFSHLRTLCVNTKGKIFSRNIPQGNWGLLYFRGLSKSPICKDHDKFISQSSPKALVG